MLSHLEHPALPMGNPVTPSFCEKGTTPVMQFIANSSWGMTPSVPVEARSVQYSDSAQQQMALCTASNNVCHCLTPLKPSEEGLSWLSVHWKCGYSVWLLCCLQLTVWRSGSRSKCVLEQFKSLDTHTVQCVVKLFNQIGPHGSVGLINSFVTPIVWTDERKDISSIHL